MTGSGRQIGRVLMRWDGVTAQPHRFGGVEFRLGQSELGHTHGDVCVDILFPRGLRDELVLDGEAEPHPVRPDSGWATVPLRVPADAARALGLLRRTYELALAQRVRQEHAWESLEVAGLEHDLAPDFF